MQVKEYNGTNMGQPKPTYPCPVPPSGNCGFPEIGGLPANGKPGYSDLQDIPLIIADKSLVAPGLGPGNRLEAELGYPVGQPYGCNSCTPPGQAPDNGAELPSPNPSAAYCTSSGMPPFFNSNVCPAFTGAWDITKTSCGRWSPEFFGSVNVVNGQVTPVLRLYPGWFRLRLVNGANTRTYDLSFKKDTTPTVPAAPDNFLSMCWKIATEAGYVKKPKSLETVQSLVMAPAERVELLCNLTRIGGFVVSRAWAQQCADNGVLCACGFPEQPTMHCTCCSTPPPPPAAAAAAARHPTSTKTLHASFLPPSWHIPCRVCGVCMQSTAQYLLRTSPQPVVPPPVLTQLLCTACCS
jgi:hypothetical protein